MKGQGSESSSWKSRVLGVCDLLELATEVAVEEARKLVHPFDNINHFPLSSSNLSMPRSHYTDEIECYEEYRENELADKEKQLKNKMPKHRRKVVEGKQILLLQFFLDIFGYEDVEAGIVDQWC